jgi:hypothetical protein
MYQNDGIRVSNRPRPAVRGALLKSLLLVRSALGRHKSDMADESANRRSIIVEITIFVEITTYKKKICLSRVRLLFISTSLLVRGRLTEPSQYSITISVR